MKTDYKFGDKVKVLTRRDGSTEYCKDVVEGIVGFVIFNYEISKFPVEVQFDGFTGLFNYDELEFLGDSEI